VNNSFRIRSLNVSIWPMRTSSSWVKRASKEKRRASLKLVGSIRTLDQLSYLLVATACCFLTSSSYSSYLSKNLAQAFYMSLYYLCWSSTIYFLTFVTLACKSELACWISAALLLKVSINSFSFLLTCSLAIYLTPSMLFCKSSVLSLYMLSRSSRLDLKSFFVFLSWSTIAA